MAPTAWRRAIVRRSPSAPNVSSSSGGTVDSNPVPRYEALIAFGQRYGLERETKEWQRRLNALTAK